MDFIDMGGSTAAEISNELSSWEPVLTENGSIYATPEYYGIDDIDNILVSVGSVIASRPPFIADEAEWMLAFLHDFRSYCYDLGLIALGTIAYSAEIESYVEDKDMLFRTKFYYLLEVIHGLLYGAKVGLFMIDMKNPKFIGTAIVQPMLRDKQLNSFRANLVEDFYQKNFKLNLSRCYTGIPVAFVSKNLELPEYCAKDLSGVDHSYSGSVAAFYKSSVSRSYKGYTEALSFSSVKGENTGLRFVFYPFFHITIRHASLETGLKELNIKVPLSSVVGCYDRSASSENGFYFLHNMHSPSQQPISVKTLELYFEPSRKQEEAENNYLRDVLAKAEAVHSGFF